MEQYLQATYPGVISNGNYVPPLVLDAIAAEINAQDPTTLADVNPTLERYGVGQDILTAAGYSVEYVSLNQDEARVRKSS